MEVQIIADSTAQRFKIRYRAKPTGKYSTLRVDINHIYKTVIFNSTKAAEEFILLHFNDTGNIEWVVPKQPNY